MKLGCDVSSAMDEGLTAIDMEQLKHWVDCHSIVQTWLRLSEKLKRLVSFEK